jgi:selenocysteine lyase/cysteine desulfurase
MASSKEQLPAEARFRQQFPVLESIAYLNAGTDGPVPERARRAASDCIEQETQQGRSGKSHMESVKGAQQGLRRRVAGLLGCDATELALTRSTTDGVNTILQALNLGPGDEVLTSDEEHPGVLAPLAGASRRFGFDIRVASFAEIASHIGPTTRLVCCSHASWVSGQVCDTAALARSGAAVLLDGAQSLGAISCDVTALGCDFYAASGQKWLCGPDGMGFLYVGTRWHDELSVPWPSYHSLADPNRSLELHTHSGASKFDTQPMSGPSAAWSLESFDLLASYGWDWIFDRGTALAQRLADELHRNGEHVTPRDQTTLVCWHDPHAEATVERLAENGVMVRSLPGRGLVRASVGAWQDDDDLERLIFWATRRG